MKKLTEKQIKKAFKKTTDQFFDYFQDLNLIKLDGTYPPDELHRIADLMDEVCHGNKEVCRTKTLNIKGFTAKDIKVVYFKRDSDWNYSFYIMKDGKDWDFYYGKSDQGAGDWWPEPEDEYDMSPIHQFIPDGFGEACENMYEYHGSHEESLELLKSCGFTVEKIDNY